MSTSDLDRSVVETAYARWAPIYDAVRGPVMVQGRRAAAAAARSLNLRPEFPFARLQAWAQASKDASLVERRKVALFGMYTLVSFERLVSAAA